MNGPVQMLERIFGKRKPKTQRIELRYVSFAEAEDIMRGSEQRWQIAPEDDNNRTLGMVYIERVK